MSEEDWPRYRDQMRAEVAARQDESADADRARRIRALAGQYMLALHADPQLMRLPLSELGVVALERAATYVDALDALPVPERKR